MIVSKFRFVFILASIMLGACAQNKFVRAVGVLTPVQLNSSSSVYDGKKVRVRGLLVLKHEQLFLVQDRDSYDKWPSDDVCVTLMHPSNLLKNRSALNMRVVEIEGVFHSDYGYNGYATVGACNISGLDLDGYGVPLIIK